MRSQPAGLEETAELFRVFARVCARDHAPLYAALCAAVANDEALLELMEAAPPAQRRPNLLLAAVHYLLLGGVDHPLAAWYPTVALWRGDAPAPAPKSDPFPAFADLCRTARDDLAAMLATRATQTTEIGRCTGLLPALCVVATRHDRPLARLDLGTSAGLTLRFDRYAYRYRVGGDVQVTAGDPTSPLTLSCELRAGSLPSLELPMVRWRRGLDQRPADPTVPDTVRWLLACQWPDHLDRFRQAATALTLAAAEPRLVELSTGDLVDDLDTAAAGAPEDSHVCVLHTWVAAYLTPERQQLLAEAVSRLAHTRPVSWLFAENPYEVPGLPLPPSPDPEAVRGASALVLVEMEGSGQHAQRLADLHHHGRWLWWWG